MTDKPSTSVGTSCDKAFPGFSTLDVKRQFRPQVESASSLLPPFYFPVASWATKIRKVLASKGILDLESEQVMFDYLPAMVKQLPSNIISILPSGNLEKIIAFLEKFDKKSGNIANCFKEGRLIETNPSISFSLLVDEMRQSMPKDTLKRTIKALAWQSLKANFPVPMRPYLNFLGILDYPDPDQLQQLNKSWEEYMGSNKQPIFANEVSPSSNTKDDIRIARLEAQLSSVLSTLDKMTDDLKVIANRPTQANSRGVYNLNADSNRSQPRNNFQPIPRGMQGGNKFKNPAFPKREDFCFYHRTFGHKAFKCQAPCAYKQGSYNSQTN